MELWCRLLRQAVIIPVNSFRHSEGESSMFEKIKRLWSGKSAAEQKFDSDLGVISTLHQVPEGFFKCSNCDQVFPSTKFGGNFMFPEKGLGCVCKNCLKLKEKGEE
jgi:hypothetical protein